MAQWKKKKKLCLKVSSNIYQKSFVNPLAATFAKSWFGNNQDKSVGNMMAIQNKDCVQVWNVNRIYPNESQLEIMDSADFYDEYVRPYIYDYAKEAFVRVATEFIELLDSMNRLEIKISRRGRWWGKNGDIDIIACDNEDRYLVGKCNWENDVFSFSMFEEFMLNVNQAGIGKDYIYLFSKDTFDGELKNFAADNDNVKLISLKDL